MSLEQLCDEMIFVATKSGIMGLDLQQKLQVKNKTSQKDIVTNADIVIEEYIKRALGRHNYDFLCEESGIFGNQNKRTWIIDPIDGTTNFFHTHPDWAISIALKEGNEIIAAVVHSPSDNKTYHAIKGGGAYLGNNSINVSKINSLDQSFLNFAYLDDQSRFSTLSQSLWDKSQKSDVMGSMAKAFCYVAQGIYESSIGLSSSIWDYAAAALIIEEAGGLIYDFKGNPIDYSKNNEHVIASNKHVSSEILNQISKVNLTEVIQK